MCPLQQEGLWLCPAITREGCLDESLSPESPLPYPPSLPDPSLAPSPPVSGRHLGCRPPSVEWPLLYPSCLLWHWCCSLTRTSLRSQGGGHDTRLFVTRTGRRLASGGGRWVVVPGPVVSALGTGSSRVRTEKGKTSHYDRAKVRVDRPAPLFASHVPKGHGWDLSKSTRDSTGVLSTQ